MTGQQQRTKSLFYYLRLEDQIPEVLLYYSATAATEIGYFR